MEDKDIITSEPLMIKEGCGVSALTLLIPIAIIIYYTIKNL